MFPDNSRCTPTRWTHCATAAFPAETPSGVLDLAGQHPDGRVTYAILHDGSQGEMTIARLGPKAMIAITTDAGTTRVGVDADVVISAFNQNLGAEIQGSGVLEYREGEFFLRDVAVENVSMAPRDERRQGGPRLQQLLQQGMRAMGAQAIMSGMNDVVLAGGVEMMSQVPMSGYHVRLHPEMTEEMIGMGFTAERVAQRWGITREQQDAFAADSHKKAAAAIQRGAFKGQVTPVAVSRTSWNGPAKTEMSATFDTDELVRPDTTAEGLGKLKPAFSAKGTVTAGNASPYSDGAAAVLMMSADRAKALGVKPLARFVSFATAGVAPDVMGVGPVKAVPKALAKAGVALDAVKLIEFNEAFAAQALAVVKDLGMDLARTNVNGGAIALGHPLGATGAKLTAQLVHELGARGGGLDRKSTRLNSSHRT